MSLIDLHIAQKLKTRREELGIKRKVIADRLRVSYQQIHKYETGKNRIPASRLYLLSQLLHVPVGYFFEGLLGSVYAEDEKHLNDEIPKLLRAYFNIRQSIVRKSFISLLKAIGETD